MKKVIIAIIVLAIAALSFLAGGWYGKGRSGGTDSEGERRILYYVDPMNPGFRSEKPGTAPCGMPLEPVYSDAGEGKEGNGMSVSLLSPGAVKISPARQQLIGVKVALVEKKPFTYSLRLYGKVVPDETRVYRINASTDSWIRELSDVTTGSIVKKDQILAEGLAPAFYNAQVTYLVAMDNIDRINQQLGGELRHQQGDLASNQIRLAVQALQNLGITDAQIEELANTRQAKPYLQVRSPVTGVVLSRDITLYQWFKAGEEFYSIADIRRLWVYADVYENEARYLRPRMAVKVAHTQMGKTFSAKVSEVLPLFDPVSKTLKVRLDVDNPRYDLRPDMFVDVEIPVTMPSSLNVPADAVIDSGTRTIVYVDMGDGTFEPRRVDTGWRLGRQVEIASGLMPGEKVVVSGNFLVDSESRMKTAAAGMQGSTSKDPVCGMYIYEKQAETSGTIAKHGNKTYYFCSEECVQAFVKEPKKYVGNEQTDKRARDDAAVPWVDHLQKSKYEPFKRSQGMEHKGIEQGKEKKDSPGKSANPPGVIDWDGDKEPAKWNKGWGGFPGAKYLGLKRKTKTKPEEDQEETAIVPPSIPDARISSEMKDEAQKQPAAGQPVPPAR